MLKLVFLGNKSTRKVHDLFNQHDNCQIREIEETEYFESLNEACNRKYHPCAYCIGSR
jgi:hypothetical protein